MSRLRVVRLAACSSYTADFGVRRILFRDRARAPAAAERVSTRRILRPTDELHRYPFPPSSMVVRAGTRVTTTHVLAQTNGKSTRTFINRVDRTRICIYIRNTYTRSRISILSAASVA